jgi:glycosyltransferase involved in cell wall biosynthesis
MVSMLRADLVTAAPADPSASMATVRVAVVVEPSWHDVPGGTALAALAVMRELRGRLDQIGVAAWHRSTPAPPFGPPIPVRHLPLPRALLYESWLRARQPHVQLVTGRVDVVHAPNIIVPPAGRAGLAVTVHDLAFLHDPSHFSAHGLSVFRRSLAIVRRRADLVLCPSMTVLDDCAAHGIAPERLRYVPNGVAPQAPAGPAEVARVRSAYGLERAYVLFNGTIEPRKNLGRLIDAFRTLVADGRDLDLVLAGPPGWGDGLAPPTGDLAARVRAVGFVPESDLRALFAGAAAFCMPSLREGFGLPILQAMAQRAPVVTSIGSSTQEVAGGAAVLVDPLDPQDIARGIVEAMERAEQLVPLGLARVAEMTWSRSADLTLDAYRELAG